VATGLPDGSHEFSRTLAEHEAAVRRYLVRYRQRQAER
jgi:cell division protein YceG involved in septum cleavage